jgi:hypothetical protein
VSFVLKGFTVLLKRAPVGRKAAAVDAAGVLGGLVLVQLADFVTGFAIENKALHVVANTHEEVAAGGKSGEDCYGFGLRF